MEVRVQRFKKKIGLASPRFNVCRWPGLMLVCWGALLVGRIAMDHKVTSLQPGISGNAPLVGSCLCLLLRGVWRPCRCHCLDSVHSHAEARISGNTKPVWP